MWLCLTCDKKLMGSDPCWYKVSKSFRGGWSARTQYFLNRGGRGWRAIGRAPCLCGAYQTRFSVFALMTAHYRPHRSLWGSSRRIWGSGLPHKAQQVAPQALRYWSILLIMGVRSKRDLTKGAIKNRQVHTYPTAGNITISPSPTALLPPLGVLFVPLPALFLSSKTHDFKGKLSHAIVRLRVLAY